MGDLIDLEKIDKDFNLRCQHAKLGVIILYNIGVPSSLIILLISIFRMIFKKKQKSFFTKIIIFIFGFEIMNCISKLLQLFKYLSEDTRPYLDKNEIETPRGIICQIQIIFSIISDLGCLSGTLLLSFRCYEVIKNKKRYFDDKKKQNFFFFLISVSSLLLALGIWFWDKNITNESIPFKYDRRDRCNYGCWLEHTLSSVIYLIYVILLIIIIVYFVLTTRYVSKSYNKMLENSVVIIEESKFSNNNNENINLNNIEETKEKQLISFEDKKRLKELQIMQIKFFIYPIISIFIWTLSSIYRIIDDFLMREIDDNKVSEKEKLGNNLSLQIFIEINLIFHSFLSSFRGILYGFAFVIFEEKAFSRTITDCLYKCCKSCFCCYNYYDFERSEDEGEEEGPLINISTNSSNTETNQKDKNEESNFRKSNASNADLNTSDYRYND